MKNQNNNNTAKKSIKKFNNTLDEKQLNAVTGGYAYTTNRTPIGPGVVFVVTINETLI